MELEHILELQELQQYSVEDDGDKSSSENHNHESPSRAQRQEYDEYVDSFPITNICSSSTTTYVAETLQRSRNCMTASTSSSPGESDSHSFPSLKARKDPHFSISKRHPSSQVVRPAQCSTHRKPIIIHTYSPKVIHTSPSKFMWLVQSLTGSPETRLRCLESRPDGPGHHPLHYSLPSAASEEAPDDKGLVQHNNSCNHVITPTPVYPSAVLTNHRIINPDFLIRNQSLVPMFNGSSTSLNGSNYLFNQPSDQAEKSCSPMSSCSSGLLEISPRGPFSATVLNGSGPRVPFINSASATIITPPAPNFENWDWSNDQMSSFDISVHSNTSVSSLLLKEADPANYTPNPHVNLPVEQVNPDCLISNFSVEFSELPNSWANARPVPLWDAYPIDTFLQTLQDPI